jgi:phage FluMu protein Com
MHLERCKQCGKLIAHIKYPWDDGGGQEIYCLDCKPITDKERELLDYAEFKAKKRHDKK